MRDKITGVGSVELQALQVEDDGMPGNSPTMPADGDAWHEPHEGHLPQQDCHPIVHNLQQRTLSDPQQHAA